MKTFCLVSAFLQYFCVGNRSGYLNPAGHVFGHSVQLLWREPETTLLFIEVFLEGNAELRQPLLDRFESISLLACRDTETHSDVTLVIFLEQPPAFVVKTGVILLLFECRIDELENVLAHRRLDGKVVHELLRFGRGISQLSICRDCLVKANDSHQQTTPFLPTADEKGTRFAVEPEWAVSGYSLLYQCWLYKMVVTPSASPTGGEGSYASFGRVIQLHYVDSAPRHPMLTNPFEDHRFDKYLGTLVIEQTYAANSGPPR
ncbi:hypothetical protein KC338_g226 [Hortaea werneckii]|nr:hypothetical protein KC338_g226 [Hortaea werneckii]